MAQQFSGKLLWISDIQKVGKKEYKKIDFAMEEVGNMEYPESIVLTLFWEDKIGAIKPFKVGETVTAMYNMKANEYDGRYFSNNNCRKVFKKKEKDADHDVVDKQDDDLPFR